MSKLVIGLGNPNRGDDAAGLEVTSRLRHVEVRRSVTGSFELIDEWHGFDEVVIVDATISGVAAGSIQRFDAIANPLPGDTFVSTHVIGIAETVEMARQLGRLPKHLEVYGIEAGTLSEGISLSPLVAEAVDQVVEELDHA